MDSSAILSYERTNRAIRDKVNDICTSDSPENPRNFRVGKSPFSDRTFIGQAFLKDKRKLKRDLPRAGAIVPRIYAYIYIRI